MEESDLGSVTTCIEQIGLATMIVKVARPTNRTRHLQSPKHFSMRIERAGTTIECQLGNIINQPDADAIVNAANAELRTGGGVAGAIHRAAGPRLEQECRPLAPIRPGDAVITGAHELPNDYVIHCLGPVFGSDKPEDRLLASCYRRALELAEANAITTIAFPAISTGAFGYPIEEAAEVALSTVLDLVPKLEVVERIRFVLFGERDLHAFEEALRSLTEL